MGAAIAILVLALALLTVASICLWVWRADRQGPSVPSSRSAKLEAERRANVLLGEILGEDEYRRMQERGYLEVRSPTVPERVYRIPKGRGRIRVYDSGMAVMKLCVGPVGGLPAADAVLAHKLMLEGDEGEYLRIANHF